jgi:fluoride exporter
MPKLSPISLLAVFLGGALGTTARYLIELSVGSSQFQPLYLTSIVNLLGAFLLGVVSSHRSFQSITKKAFVGTGLLGGFTTMSGLALLTGNAAYGLGPGGWAFWLFVAMQMVVGVLLFALGRKIGLGRGKK